MIINLASMSSIPWCIIGDFNDLLMAEDKKGRVEHPPWLISGFRETVRECNLTDLPPSLWLSVYLSKRSWIP